MQNRIPSQNASAFPPWLEEVYVRLKARMHAQVAADEPSAAPTAPAGQAEAGLAEPRLHGAELLGAIRPPLDWLLAVAHRSADGDPVDTAAVDRLRAALGDRIDGTPIRIHKTDLLTAFDLLLEALDSVVHRALGDAAYGPSALFGSNAALAIDVTSVQQRLAELLAGPRPQRSSEPHVCCGLCTHHNH